MNKFYVTYGGGSQQAGQFSVVEAASYEHARAQIETVCGSRFAFCYTAEKWLTADGDTQEDRYSLTQIPLQRQESKRTVLPTKFATPFEDELALPEKEVQDYSSALPEDSEPGRMNAPARPDANFDEKVYMFPESYNALRRELFENWPSLFQTVGHAMAFDAIRFIELMDAALDTKTTFDTAKVDSISKKYLNLLRNKRGLSSL